MWNIPKGANTLTGAGQIIFFVLILALTIPAVRADVNWGPNSVLTFYSDSSASNTRIKDRDWNVSSSTLRAEQSLIDTGLSNAGVSGMEACSILNKNQTIVIDWSNETLYAEVLNATTGLVGNNQTLSKSYPTNFTIRDKPASCFTEQLGKRVVIVGQNMTAATASNDLWIWNGTNYEWRAWNVDDSAIVISKSLWAVAQAGTNNAMVFGENQNNQSTVQFWNSSSSNFDVTFNLSGINEGSRETASAPGAQRNKTVDCSFESVSGRAVCFWANWTNTSALYVTQINVSNNGAATLDRTDQFNLTSTANITGFPRIQFSISNPIKNEILLSVDVYNVVTSSVTFFNLSYLVWNGTAISASQQVDTNYITNFNGLNKDTDGAYRYFTDNSTSSQALMCWPSRDRQLLNCTSWNGTVFSGDNNTGNFATFSNTLTQTRVVSYVNGIAGNQNYWAITYAEVNDTINSFDLVMSTFNDTNWSNQNTLTTTLQKNVARFPYFPLWTIYDNTTPVFSNPTQNASLITASSQIFLNASTRDNFQIDASWLETNESGNYLNYTNDAGRIVYWSEKNTIYKHANFTWSNISSGGRTVGWRICSNDTMNDIACSAFSSFKVDTCTPEQGKNWNINALDNCVVDRKDYSVLQIRLFGGSGYTIFKNSNITSTACTVQPNAGSTITVAIEPTTSWANAC